MIEILAHMEIQGIKVDNNFLKTLSKKFENKINNLEKEIFKISKKKFNIGSTKQLGEIMYNELKIANIKKTKKGSFATSAQVLEDLSFKGHKLPKLVLIGDKLQNSKIHTQIRCKSILIKNREEFIHHFFLQQHLQVGWPLVIQIYKIFQ